MQLGGPWGSARAIFLARGLSHWLCETEGNARATNNDTPRRKYLREPERDSLNPGELNNFHSAPVRDWGTVL